MKKIIAMVVSCLLVLPMALFAGCNGGGENDDEIEMWAGGQWTGDDLQNLREFINDFNADNELGFTIKLTPKAELEVSLSAALATGNAPDLLVWDRFNTPTYAKQDFLYPIDNLIAQDGIDSSKYHEETWNELNYEGKQYGLPLDLGYWGVYVNKDLVDEYNGTDEGKADPIDLSIEKWDWDQLYDTTVKLTKYNENGTLRQAGCSTTAISEHIVSFYNSTGKDFLGEDGMSDFNTPEFKATLEFMKKMYDGKDGKKFSQNGMDDKTAFVNGQLAMIFQPNYFASYLEENAQDMEWVFMPQPRYPGEGGVNGGMLGGFGLAIPNPQANTGTYPEEPTESMLKAWEFMKWWAYDENNSLEWTKVSASFPSLLLLQTSEYIQSDPMMKTCADYAQYQKVRPSIPGWLFIQTNVFNINIPNYFAGNIGLQSVIDKMTEDADNTILTYRK